MSVQLPESLQASRLKVGHMIEASEESSMSHGANGKEKSWRRLLGSFACCFKPVEPFNAKKPSDKVIKVICYSTHLP